MELPVFMCNLLNSVSILLLPAVTENRKQNFSLQYQYNVKQTSDENQER